MGKRMQKEGSAGAAIAYITRKQAMKKLQLSLKDFRRLCIIKGIYPVEPKNKKKVNQGSTAYRTFYYLKDIQFMAHDPLIDRYRSLKIMLRKVKKAKDKGEQNKVDKLYENMPTYTLGHVIKERYPSFHLALEELSDALSHCALFSTFPKSKLYPIEFTLHSTKVLTEFLLYVIQTRALRKVFVSIKGIYYEAEVMGQQITWVVPHRRGYKKAVEVDYHVLTTFVEFYIELLRHVNAKLYRDINLFYPPKLATSASLPKDDYILAKGENIEIEQLASLAHPIQGSKPNQEDDEDKVEIDEELYEGEDEDALSQQREKLLLVKKQKKLFEGLKFFLNREVPFEPLVICIRSCGGQVSWERTMGAGATFPENDSGITHQIVDRPSVSTTYINRYYVQPQWVFDSLNAGLLLPEEKYFMGVEPPPHLSPFVEEKEGEYMPPEKKALLRLKKGEIKDDDEEQMSNEEDEPSDEESNEEDEEEEEEGEKKKSQITQKTTKKRKALTPEEKEKQEAAEAKRMAIMMMPKKSKKLFTKIMKAKKHQRKEVENYAAKRKAFEEQKKLEKKQKTQR